MKFHVTIEHSFSDPAAFANFAAAVKYLTDSLSIDADISAPFVPAKPGEIATKPVDTVTTKPQQFAAPEADSAFGAVDTPAAPAPAPAGFELTPPETPPVEPPKKRGRPKKENPAPVAPAPAPVAADAYANIQTVFAELVSIAGNDRMLTALKVIGFKRPSEIPTEIYPHATALFSDIVAAAKSGQAVTEQQIAQRWAELRG